MQLAFTLIATLLPLFAVAALCFLERADREFRKNVEAVAYAQAYRDTMKAARITKLAAMGAR